MNRFVVIDKFPVLPGLFLKISTLLNFKAYIDLFFYYTFSRNHKFNQEVFLAQKSGTT